jgi:valyl-tRNA synthetase
MNLSVDEEKEYDLNLEDKWILHKLNELIKEVTENLENYELGIAFDKIYSFIWDEFCDWYIEMVKPRVFAEDKSAAVVLNRVLINALKLLHPFMPFITEEIYQSLRGAPATWQSSDFLMLSDFPLNNEEWNFESGHSEVEMLKEIITQIRNKRAEINAHPAKKAKIYIETLNEEIFQTEFFKKLSISEEIVFAYKSEHPSINTFTFAPAPKTTITMETGNLVDVDKKRKMLEDEIAKFKKELEFNQKMLDNPSFVDKAPTNLIEEKRQKCKNYEAGLADLEKQLSEMG